RRGGTPRRRAGAGGGRRHTPCIGTATQCRRGLASRGTRRTARRNRRLPQGLPPVPAACPTLGLLASCPLTLLCSGPADRRRGRAGRFTSSLRDEYHRAVQVAIEPQPAGAAGAAQEWAGRPRPVGVLHLNGHLPDRAVLVEAQPAAARRPGLVWLG